MAIELTPNESYERVRQLIGEYFGFYSVIPARSVIESKLENLSVSGTDVIRLIDDLEIREKQKDKRETKEQVGQAIDIYNDRKRYGL